MVTTVPIALEAEIARLATDLPVSLNEKAGNKLVVRILDQ